MKKDLKRRDFLNTCFKAGVTCCALTYAAKLPGQEGVFRQETKPDPKSLAYCGYRCTQECPLKKASGENNTEQKKKAYEAFNFKGKYGVDFDPEKIFCYGCKPKDKPLGIIVNACTVRKCVISKGYDCCIQCSGLTACDKELWTSFPNLKKAVIGIQKKYLEG
jgi:hypothetical protein